ncbi:CPBP family intramembrane glutamic endopeptidase [Bacillus sp. KH172YL63]|uniref:CPBP family intramembrane glutamic endopeptidase n=1 Tax=Bacillus sp. KH172YL63 TaxID=2709784 RepID=UPI0013E505EF|nr:type II CAAX endopeptidase family protein [Bacillus sp. KH172YL63]BCB05229.1 hypothetical protein KH172YL63_33620 [Bacillus sp. KH172YL63]
MQPTLSTNQPISIKERAATITVKTLSIYLILIIVPGYFINQLSLEGTAFEGMKGYVWFAYFMMVTFGYKEIRRFIASLLNVRVFREKETYVWMFVSFFIPYGILHLCLYYEVFLNEYFIYQVKYNMLPAGNLWQTIDAAVLTPVTEEIMVRGIILSMLLKRVKPLWAITITSMLFGLIHPSSAWMFTIAGGFLLTLTAYKTKSILPGIVAHALWNLYMVQLILYF